MNYKKEFHFLIFFYENEELQNHTVPQNVFELVPIPS